MPSKAVRVEGVCALTGDRGKYVRSHILPRALTLLSSRGEKAFEGGLGLPLVRRPPTWYDDQLVTARGEAVLEAIDAAGIAELRRHRLIWGSWNGANTIPTNDVEYEDGRPLSRILDVPRPDILRLFFISLAWRVAASSRPECQWVRPSRDEIEDLRRRVVARDAGPAEDYPVQLFQCIDRGYEHNRSPLLEEQIVPLPEGPEQHLRYVRFYFDGLTAWMYLARARPLLPELLSIMLAHPGATFVTAQRFDQTRAAANLVEIAQDYARRQSSRGMFQTQTANAVRRVFRPDDANNSNAPLGVRNSHPKGK